MAQFLITCSIHYFAVNFTDSDLEGEKWYISCFLILKSRATDFQPVLIMHFLFSPFATGFSYFFFKTQLPPCEMTPPHQCCPHHPENNTRRPCFFPSFFCLVYVAELSGQVLQRLGKPDGDSFLVSTSENSIPQTGEIRFEKIFNSLYNYRN